jgi:hypothetical protein
MKESERNSPVILDEDPYRKAMWRKQHERGVAKQAREDKLFTIGPEADDVGYEDRFADALLSRDSQPAHGLAALFAEEIEAANRGFEERRREAEWKCRVADKLGEEVDEATRALATAESAQGQIDAILSARKQTFRQAQHEAMKRQ